MFLPDKPSVAIRLALSPTTLRGELVRCLQRSWTALMKGRKRKRRSGLLNPTRTNHFLTKALAAYLWTTYLGAAYLGHGSEAWARVPNGQRAETNEASSNEENALSERDAASTSSSAEKEESEDDSGYRFPGRNFEAPDYGALIFVQGTYYAVEFSLKSRTRATWTEPIPVIDQPLRDFVVAPTRVGRESADKASDYFWYANIIHPFLVAAVIPPIRGSGFNAPWQMTMINLQAFALSSLVVRVPHKLLGRTRPYLVDCEQDETYSAKCDSTNRYASFPSGHTQIAMTGAGLACAHHIHGRLLDHPVADGAACVASFLSASSVGYLRMRADRHWLSDTIIGAAIGFGIGYGIPVALHYHPFWRKNEARTERAKRDSTLSWMILPQVGPGHIGVNAIMISK